jgi:hypothetical protein
MPTILLVNGWRFFFYSNENNEPIHIHCQKSGKEFKFWLNQKDFDIEEAYSYNLNVKDKREVKKIIFEYFELIEQEWTKFQSQRKQ